MCCWYTSASQPVPSSQLPRKTFRPDEKKLIRKNRFKTLLIQKRQTFIIGFLFVHVQLTFLVYISNLILYFFIIENKKPTEFFRRDVGAPPQCNKIKSCLEKYFNSNIKFVCVYLGNLLMNAAQFSASWQLLLLCLLRGAPRGGGGMLNRMLGRICSIARMQTIKCLKIIIKNFVQYRVMI